MSAALWLLVGSIALAKDEPGQQFGPIVEKNYMLPYFLIGLALVLGVLVVCRASRRAERPDMPEQDLEDHMRKMSGKL